MFPLFLLDINLFFFYYINIAILVHCWWSDKVLITPLNFNAKSTDQCLYSIFVSRTFGGNLINWALYICCQNLWSIKHRWLATCRNEGQVKSHLSINYTRHWRVSLVILLEIEYITHCVYFLVHLLIIFSFYLSFPHVLNYALFCYAIAYILYYIIRDDRLYYFLHTKN